MQEAARISIGTVIRGETSRTFATATSLPRLGKKARQLMPSIYTAVSNAEISSTITPTNSKVPPASSAASAKAHFDRKPLKRGMPVRESAATVKQPKVRGIFLPMPPIAVMYCFLVLCSTAPAAKKAQIFMSEWKSMCSTPACSPAGVIRVTPKRM